MISDRVQVFGEAVTYGCKLPQGNRVKHLEPFNVVMREHRIVMLIVRLVGNPEVGISDAGLKNN